MASGNAVPHKQAGHMAAPTSLAPPSKKTLAKGEPSTHGTSRPDRRQQGRSALGSEPTSSRSVCSSSLTQTDPLRVPNFCRLASKLDRANRRRGVFGSRKARDRRDQIAGIVDLAGGKP